jgi:hypothetical protein
LLPRESAQHKSQVSIKPVDASVPLGRPVLGTPFGYQPTEAELQATFGALAPFFAPQMRSQIAQIHPQTLQSPSGYVPASGMTSQMPTQGSMTPQPHPPMGSGMPLPSMGSYNPAQGSTFDHAAALEDVAKSPTSVVSMSTSPSNVKELVENSKFHDEILCQLLDAARLNLIGSEAKKALQRAARARVIELRDMRKKGEVGLQSKITARG